MKKTTLQLFRTLFLVTALVGIAVSCHILSHRAHTTFFPLARFLDFTRTFIYIGLFATWGISISRRIPKTYTRKTLHGIAMLMVFWLVVREIKFRFVPDGTFMRYLWYLYYIPILMIPLLTLFVSFSLGKPEGYRPPRWRGALYFITLTLTAAVLTNDFHQLVFRFPDDRTLWSENTNQYNILYYAIALWVLTCTLWVFIVMLTKTRVPKSKRILWLPLLPFCIILTYIILYNLRVPFVRQELNDFAVFFCLSSAGFLESCIRCGLIPSNTCYSDLFETLTSTPIQILDREYQVHYSSDSSEPLDTEIIKKSKTSPQILANKTLLHCNTVKGGYVVFTENLSELLERKETLEERHEELLERNALLQHEYEKEREHRTTLEQNRLYDLLQKKTQRQIDRIDELAGQFSHTDKEDEQQKILAHIMVLGTFIKRRKDFILSANDSDKMTDDMLINALQESFHALRLFSIKGGFFANTKEKNITGTSLTLAYDFFEQVIETVLDRVHYVNVRIDTVNGGLRINILTDYLGEYDSIFQSFPTFQIFCESDSTEFILSLEGGDTA